MLVITDYLLAFCRITIGLVFLFSGCGKLRDVPRFSKTVADFRLLPERLSGLAALFFIGSELAVVGFMLAGGLLLLSGFLLAVLLLLIFCLALASVLVREHKVSCNCFGASKKVVSVSTIWRNTGLAICALGGCGAQLWLKSSQIHLGMFAWAITALGSVIFVLIWLQLDEIVQLLQQR